MPNNMVLEQHRVNEVLIQEAKAEGPIYSTFSGISILVRFRQLLNVELSILVNPDGSVIFSSETQ